MTLLRSVEQDRWGAAAIWFARLQGEPAFCDWKAFQSWLEASPGHRQAYADVEALWLDLDLVAADRAMAGSACRDRCGSPRRLVSGVLAGVAAVAAAAIILVTIFQPAAPTSQTYATSRGETRTVTLADGSKLTLGGETLIKARLSPRSREVSLAHGEVRFDVVHDAASPFVVRAGDHDVHVLGTEFNVLRSDDRLAVTVRRGTVEISAMGGDTRRLVRGDQLVHRQGQKGSLVRRVSPEEALSWTTGRRTYVDAPLSDVVEDLDRYVAHPIRVDDATGALKVSGVLVIDNEALILKRLELFAPVTARPDGAEFVLKPR